MVPYFSFTYCVQISQGLDEKQKKCKFCDGPLEQIVQMPWSFGVFFFTSSTHPIQRLPLSLLPSTSDSYTLYVKSFHLYALHVRTSPKLTDPLWHSTSFSHKLCAPKLNSRSDLAESFAWIKSYKRSIRVDAAVRWNSLPVFMRQCDNYNLCKYILKQHLMCT